jgi:transglutaminase-like putative cysteine protease
MAEAIRGFKDFLESRHQDISQSTEYLPFYALPYVPNPAGHPSFRQLFTDEWLRGLIRHLSEWLDYHMTPPKPPALVEALAGAIPAVASTDPELWAAALELADALQNAVAGRVPPRAYVDELCGRIGIFPGGAVCFSPVAPPLDFASITRDLRVPEAAGPILKSFVLRLTRPAPDQVRRFFVELIAADALQISTALVTGLCRAPGPLRSYSLKLLNILATDGPGRHYLNRSTTLLSTTLMPIASEEPSGDVDNSIGALQKLSLVPDAMAQIIKIGAVDVVVRLLADAESHSQYAREYAAALMMGMCARKDATRRCVENDALTVLAGLLGTSGENVQSYVNATLVELFGIEPRTREKARVLGLPGLLNSVKRRASHEIAEQIDYVMRAMAGKVEYVETEQVEDEEPEKEVFEAYEEVCEESWTFECEGEELLAKYVMGDGADQMMRTIDSNLRQSVQRLSVSLRGGKSARRRPSVANTLTKSMKKSPRLVATTGLAKQPTASQKSTASQRSTDRSQHSKGWHGSAL